MRLEDLKERREFLKIQEKKLLNKLQKIVESEHSNICEISKFASKVSYSVYAHKFIKYIYCRIVCLLEQTNYSIQTFSSKFLFSKLCIKLEEFEKAIINEMVYKRMIELLTPHLDNSVSKVDDNSINDNNVDYNMTDNTINDSDNSITIINSMNDSIVAKVFINTGEVEFEKSIENISDSNNIQGNIVQTNNIQKNLNNVQKNSNNIRANQVDSVLESFFTNPFKVTLKNHQLFLLNRKLEILISFLDTIKEMSISDSEFVSSTEYYNEYGYNIIIPYNQNISINDSINDKTISINDKTISINNQDFKENITKISIILDNLKNNKMQILNILLIMVPGLRSFFFKESYKSDKNWYLVEWAFQEN